ncbi:MAG: tetratricopeptide repeat protein [Deltaproteobacteria bacterium]|nr:tetratricopeptide repeat protein [Deltaproteobacteria bacterium]
MSAARRDRLWPVLSVLVGLLLSVGVLESYARQREADPIDIEIHAAQFVPEDDQAISAEVVGAAHARARTAALRGDIEAAIGLLETELEGAKNAPILLLELGHWRSVHGDHRLALEVLTQARAVAPKDARIAFELGLAHKRAGDAESAERELRAALALNASHSSARVALGDLLRRRDALDEAIQILTPATSSGGNDERARASVALGRALLGAKKRADADRAFEQAILWAPAQPEIRVSIARALLESGGKSEAPRALALVTIAAQLAPDVADVYVALGRAREALDEDSQALEAYERALRIDPADRFARIRTIRLTLARGDYVGARIRSERLVSDAPEVPEHHFLLGLVAARAERAEDSRAAYRAAIDRARGQYPEAFFNLGLLEAKTGRSAEAAAAYETAIAQRPDYLEAHNNLGLLHSALKNWDRAETAFRRALELDPTYSPAWFNLGMGQLGRGQLDAAIDALKQAAKVDPKGKKARLELGVAYAKSGRLDEAIATYQSLLAEEPRYVTAIYDLGLAFEAKGQLDKARDQLERALALDPEHQRSRRKLVSISLALGQFEVARGHAAEALEREPGHRSSRLLLAKALASLGRDAECRAAVEQAGVDRTAPEGAHDFEAALASCSNPSPTSPTKDSK